MKLYLLTLLLVPITLLSISIEISGDNFNISGSFDYSIDKGDRSELSLNLGDQLKSNPIDGKPFYSTFLALPNDGNLTLAALDYSKNSVGGVDQFNDYSFDSSEPKITIGDPVIMGGYRFVQISIFPFFRDGDNLYEARDLDIHLKWDISKGVNPLTRSNSYSIDPNLLPNISGVKIAKNSNQYRGVYLFLYPDGVESYIEPFKEWKEKLGYKVHMVKKSEAGSSAYSIKNYLQDAYDNWELPPQYLILFGDVTGSYTIPTFYIDGYLLDNAATDHKYTMLSGDDYFSDIQVGRFSFSTITQLTSIISKVMKYERTPYTGSNWYSRGLMACYNSSDYYDQYHSGRETLMSVRDKLYEFTYTEVDTFITPDQYSPIQLRSKINSGYSIVSYRGFGGAHYWTNGYDFMFENDDISALNNGLMLPLVTSIVCGGGDYADQNYPNCFGELWLNAGTATNHKGAIGFIGPSEHDTKTPFNNCNTLGIYQGFTKEGIRSCGSLMNRGKMELYLNYPHNHAMGDATNSDQFYFYVYNLIGDPGLNVLHMEPQSISCGVVKSPSSGYSSVELKVNTPIQEQLWATLLDDNGIIKAVKVSSDGMATIDHTFIDSGYSVVISGVDYIPEEIDLTLDQNLSFEIIETPHSFVAGDQTDLTLKLKNISGNTLNNLDLQFEFDNLIECEVDQYSISGLNSGDIEEITLPIAISKVWDGKVSGSIKFGFDLERYILPVEISSHSIVFNGFNQDLILTPNSEIDLNLNLKNSSEFDISNLSLELLESENQYLIIDGNFPLTQLNSGDSIDVEFKINLLSLWSGEPVLFGIKIKQSGEMVSLLEFSGECGEITKESPTFSSYGYVAIESRDLECEDHPTYEWIEISPYAGGAGTQLHGTSGTSDGWVEAVDLPFTFKYYGVDYNKVTVGSNGYISMGEIEEIFHRNKFIPSGNGPSAMIAPLWDRYKVDNGYVYYYYDEENSQFIVQWKNMRSAYSQSARQYFQLILKDPEIYPTETGDGEIIFQYQQVESVDEEDNYFTSGIENYDQSEGLLLSYSDIYPNSVHTFENETAILITTKSLGVVGTDEQLIDSFTLNSNYPNPFNPSTHISFNLPKGGEVSLEVYNSRGEVVFSKTNNYQIGGTKGINFDGSKLSSGVYYYRASFENQINYSKMVLIK
jgi:hypothetical protein